MELKIVKGGMLTTVQDLGRWGFQSDGVPVAGAMDLAVLQMGNVMLGNDAGDAALEVTLLGPEIMVEGEGTAVFAGADLGFSLNRALVGSWKVVSLKKGDVISFTGPRANGCRGYLCFAGGVDVAPVMNSRSTYTRAKIGGFEGRALKAGDVISTGESSVEAGCLEGFALPPELCPDYSPERPLKIVTGLQQDAFTEKGLETLFSSEYTISNESDRMGCRFEGPKVEHKEAGADIVSDAIPLGAVQIPGHGMPIAMLADRQTTGGYTKVGVLTPDSICALVQRMPGSKVFFARATVEEAAAELQTLKESLGKIAALRERWQRDKCEPVTPVCEGKVIRRKEFRLTIDGKSYDVLCEEIE